MRCEFIVSNCSLPILDTAQSALSGAWPPIMHVSFFIPNGIRKVANKHYLKEL
jgi:hypothetical protein